MWPEQVHILLTYTCGFECDHCFVYSGPEAEGTFTVDRLRSLLDQSAEIESVEWIYFEGGEPFLMYPLLLEGVRRARAHGFEVGIVSNSYWAESEDNARLWLEPLAELGIGDLSLSDDEFHFGTGSEQTPAGLAAEVARDLGIPVGSITIDPPRVETDASSSPGEPITGGAVMFRGRAVDRLIDGLPRRPVESLVTCPYEELATPIRVHVDAYGHVQVCQGISIGNVWETPLARIVEDYDPHGHPVCGPLLRGGPLALARERGVSGEEGYVDECHLCFVTRRALLDEFPKALAPRQVYG